jgi:hypothetical protein
MANGGRLAPSAPIAESRWQFKISRGAHFICPRDRSFIAAPLQNMAPPAE